MNYESRERNRVIQREAEQSSAEEEAAEGNTFERRWKERKHTNRKTIRNQNKQRNLQTKHHQF